MHPGLSFLAMALAATELPPTDIRGDVPEQFRDAPAVVLLEQRAWNVIPMRRARLSVTRRVLIQNTRGLDQAEQEIVYRASDSDLEDFHARTIQLDGRAVPVPEDLTHERLLMKTADHELRALQFTFAQVQVGSVLELEYVIVEHDPPYFQDWNVQRDIPVLETRFRVSMKQPLQPWKVEISSHAETDERCQTVEDEWSVRRLRYELLCSFVPALREESSAPPEKDTRLDFRVSTLPVSTRRMATWFWDSIGRGLYGVTDEFLGDGNAAAQLGAELVNDTMSKEQKLNAVYDYVKREIEYQTTYDVFDNPRAGIESVGVDDVLERGGGNPFEITMLTLALLRGAGLDVRPLLANDRSRGRFVFDLPDSGLAAHAMLLVEIDDRSAVLDPSCRYCTAGVPDWRYCDRGTSALVVGRRGVKPIEIGLVPADHNIAVHNERVVVRPDSGNTVSGSVLWNGHYDVDLRQRWEDLSEAARIDDFRKSLAGEFEDVEVRLSDPKAFFEPLTADYEYVRTDQHRTPDGRLLVRPSDPFSEALPIPVQEERLHPLWFRYGFTVQAKTVFEIPPGYALPRLPAKRAVVNGPGLTFHSRWRQVPNRREIEWTGMLVLARIRIVPDDYTQARDFALAVRGLLRQGIVIRPEQTAPRGEQ